MPQVEWTWKRCVMAVGISENQSKTLKKKKCIELCIYIKKTSVPSESLGDVNSLFLKR